jgi:2'-5' RNA ligase
MPAEQYHVTLRFLGGVSPELVTPIVAAMGEVAAIQRSFEVAVSGGGGMQGRSDAIWLQVTRGAAAVSALADAIDARLPAEVLGDPPRARPGPHLTIARRGSAELVAALRASEPEATDAVWQADRVVLFRSFTGTPAGSRYEPIAEAPLGAAAGTSMSPGSSAP